MMTEQVTREQRNLEGMSYSVRNYTLHVKKSCVSAAIISQFNSGKHGNKRIQHTTLINGV
jgi:hypothetical protein